MKFCKHIFTLFNFMIIHLCKELEHQYQQKYRTTFIWNHITVLKFNGNFNENEWHEANNAWCINSLVPGWCGSNYKSMVFKLIIENGSLGIWCVIALRKMPQNVNNHRNGKSNLVQMLAWCQQATCHCLSLCWHRLMLPKDITRPLLFYYTQHKNYCHVNMVSTSYV